MTEKQEKKDLENCIPKATRGPFLESPETLRAIFGCHNCLCISRIERISVVELHSHFSFCYLENMLKNRISKTSGWQFHKWLLGSETFSGLSRTGPQWNAKKWAFKVFSERRVVLSCKTWCKIDTSLTVMGSSPVWVHLILGWWTHI